MTLLHRVASIVRWISRRDRAEQDLDDELRTFVDMAAADQIRDGAESADARRLAVLQLGGLEQAKEHVRTGRHGARLDEVMRDVCYALRLLRRSPGFAVVATLTIAVAIGATTAMFSVVRAALLAPLPFADPDRLVVVWEGYPPTQPRAAVSAPGYENIRAAKHIFADAAAIVGANVNLTGSGEPERLDVALVTQSFQPVLGLHVALGRWFTTDEDASNQNDAIVLSDGLWRRRFGSDRAVLGRTIILDDRPHRVVGIMSASSTYPKGVDGWIPIAFTPQQRTDMARGSQYLGTIARLQPGLTHEQARAALQTVAQTLRAAHYADTPRWTLDMRPLKDELIANARPILLSAFGAVTLVLIVACANVANLLLARSGQRRAELAVRSAVGASPERLRRQLLVETGVLGATGALGGLVIASATLPLLTAVVAETFPRLPPPTLDGGVFIFGLGIALVSTLAFGLTPAWVLSRVDLRSSLADSRPGAAKGRPRVAFVVGQVAIAFALLVASGLLVGSFRTIMAIDPGFAVDRRLTFLVSLPEGRYRDRPQRAAFWAALFDRLVHVPGVRNAAAVSELPLSNWGNMGTFEIEGRTFARADLPHANWRSVSAAYFATMGIALVDGRPFSPRDSDNSARVAIIDELGRARYWGTENPIGARIAIAHDENDRPVWSEIIGVVRTVHHSSLEEEIKRPTLYLPLAQRPTATAFTIVETDGDPLAIAAAARTAILEIDPRLPIYNVQPLEARLDNSLGQRRISLWLIGLFGAIAGILAIVGVYGVVAYDVSRRSQEMAVRMALGADRAALMRLVFRSGLRMAAFGIAFGAVVAFALAHAARALLFGVSPFDTATYVVLGSALLFVTAVATYIPAHRAATVDPLITLRS
jgi:predicted permease